MTRRAPWEIENMLVHRADGSWRFLPVHNVYLPDDPVPPTEEFPLPSDHLLIDVHHATVPVGGTEEERKTARWECSCGATGTSIQASPDQDLDQRARRAYASHVRRQSRHPGSGVYPQDIT